MIWSRHPLVGWSDDLGFGFWSDGVAAFGIDQDRHSTGALRAKRSCWDHEPWK